MHSSTFPKYFHKEEHFNESLKIFQFCHGKVSSRYAVSLNCRVFIRKFPSLSTMLSTVLVQNTILSNAITCRSLNGFLLVQKIEQRLSE